MKLLVSTWGLPSRWSNSVYDLNGVTCNSCTTLKLLHGNYDRVLVIVLDSILDSGEKSNMESECSKCFYKHRQDFTYGSYADLLEKVRVTISGTLECLGIQNADVIVLPAAGSPSGNWVFQGNMKDYLSIGLIDLYEHVKKLGNIREIAIDLTHGINFMPSLSFRMAQIISQFAFLNNESQDNQNGVHFSAYNSDPFTSIYNLKINKVYDERVTSVEIPGYLPHKVFMRSEKIDTNTDSIDQEFEDVVKPLISSVFYPLPLALSYFCGRRFSGDLRGAWEDNISIVGATVRRKLSPDPVAVQAVILADILSSKVEAGFSIRDLKAINERIYGRISGIHHFLAGHELSKINVVIEKYRGQLPATLAKVMEEEKNTGTTRSDAPIERADKRIMMAHAGLQKEFVIIKRDKKIGYAEDPRKILRDAGMLL